MTSSYSGALVALMDDFAIMAMQQLINTYAPETMDDKEEMIQWCESVASTSYVLAAAMMGTRAVAHKNIIENFQDEKSNAD